MRRVGYNHLVSNKREWNNCFIKKPLKSWKTRLKWKEKRLQKFTRTLTIFVRHGINGSYTMATKPIKFFELHYTTTQFLIVDRIFSHVTRLDQSRTSENTWWIINALMSIKQLPSSSSIWLFDITNFCVSQLSVIKQSSRVWTLGNEREKTGRKVWAKAQSHLIRSRSSRGILTFFYWKEIQLCSFLKKKSYLQCDHLNRATRNKVNQSER